MHIKVDNTEVMNDKYVIFSIIRFETEKVCRYWRVLYSELTEAKCSLMSVQSGEDKLRELQKQ